MIDTTLRELSSKAPSLISKITSRKSRTSFAKIEPMKGQISTRTPPELLTRIRS